MTINSNRKQKLSAPFVSHRNVRRRMRGGFSLLEVILALALTGVIVAAIAMAIHLHLVMLTKQQEQIEQAHVARNTLELMSIDIRAAIQYKPFAVDTVDIDEAAESNPAAVAGAAGAAGGETGETGGGVDPAAGGMDPTGGTGEEQPSMSEDIQSSVIPMPHPGFYGNSKEIMFSLSRLPRMDQYNPYIQAGNDNVSIPADIKTTSFFVDMSGSLGGDPLQQNPIGGLYRRQLAHAAASYANTNGYTLSSNATTELIAPEVVDMAFRYFDGEEWSDAWDSDELGGFPKAVEITIIVDPRRKEGAVDLPEYTGFDEEFMQAYRKVVHLPVAEMLSDEELQAIEESQQSVAESSESEEEEGGGGQ